MVCAPASSGSLVTNPREVAACMKKRFGQVGPGSDANQRVHTQKFLASPDSTGSDSGAKHCMIVLPLLMSPPTSLMKLLTNPFIGAGSGCPILAPNNCSRTPSKLWLGSATVMAGACWLTSTRSEFGVAG